MSRALPALWASERQFPYTLTYSELSKHWAEQLDESVEGRQMEIDQAVQRARELLGRYGLTVVRGDATSIIAHLRGWGTVAWDAEGSALRGDLLETITETMVAGEKLTSIREVVRSGLEPSVPRAFKARQLTQVRCVRRGHVLARVYATGHLPVLVPTIGIPTIPGFDARTEFSSEQTAEIVDKNYNNWTDASLRSSWFWGIHDTDDDPAWATIPGTFAFAPRDLHHPFKWMLEEEASEIYGLTLLCRCGWNAMKIDDLRPSLTSGRAVRTTRLAGESEVRLPGHRDVLGYPYKLHSPS